MRVPVVDYCGRDAHVADAGLLVVVLSLSIYSTNIAVLGCLLCGVTSGHAVEEVVT